MRDGALGEFLRSRRKALTPEQVRLPVSAASSRRTGGLRREEVALLAGVSADYYARLEQGRKTAASGQVLAALADALVLDDSQRRHLFNLARSMAADRAHDGRRHGSAQPPQSARLGLVRLMETVGDAPAVLHGRGTDILAANEAARAVIADFYTRPARERNVTRWFFLDQESRRFGNWDEVASDIIGMLRYDVGRYPGDTRLQALVTDLSAESPLFRAFWHEHRVAIGPGPRKVIHHPTAGTLEFDVEGVSPSADRDQTLYVFMARTGSVTTTAMTRLMTAWRNRGG